MNMTDLLILNAEEVSSILSGREQQIFELVKSVYELQDSGQISLPYSTFLRLPNAAAGRIIALPAYVGGPFDIAGIKWIASVPENLGKGLERATALIVINDPETGRPMIVLEGSHISAARTAASAALAAQILVPPSDTQRCFGLIGCGRINLEVVRFLRYAFRPNLDLYIFDLYRDRAAGFKERLEEIFPELKVHVANSLDAVFEECRTISFATTSTQPYVRNLGQAANGSTILHISLRDLAPEIILNSDNVVDDVDHVCRAQTSVHLAAEVCQHRNFMQCTLTELLTGKTSWRRDVGRTTIFSPFGLGFLDIALAKLVAGIAVNSGVGLVVPHFLPERHHSKGEERLSRSA